ncbi:uncharacterized protein LOC113755741 isoform X3 [Coffea eugenioides]|uniref:Uncharacterized protein isoform X3 n=1 Tax=Coffea arabica TaxID=13443 RepID=A0A6P6USN3_COFAR|nr:uncharacterized protein LOC113755741 isoform X3 [Coffea eugenioides]
MAVVVANGRPLITALISCNLPHIKFLLGGGAPTSCRTPSFSSSLPNTTLKSANAPHHLWNFKPSASRYLPPVLVFKHQGPESDESSTSKDKPEGQHKAADDVMQSLKGKAASGEISFLSKLVVLLAVALAITVLSIGFRQPNQRSLLGIQHLVDSSSAPALSTHAVGFSFRAFGYRIILPEYAPGWIYFWLLMAAGCGLFISEEALNIWVGITLARMLSLDGTWHSFLDSFSRNAHYIVSTVLWVYWGVCISDMIPFYLGKLFRQSGASDDVSSKLGIGREKALKITRVVQKYGNLVGVVERFSLGVRNPTAFLAGAMGISPEFFFAGVCCGGLITLPLQLGIGFLFRDRPVFALATVATVVGIWTIIPYAAAALTALFLYLRRKNFS